LPSSISRDLVQTDNPESFLHIGDVPSAWRGTSSIQVPVL
jgi:hypothetical protein